MNNLIVVMLDVNGLKIINDTIGHDAGDELIKGATGCIKEHLLLLEQHIVLEEMNLLPYLIATRLS